MPRIYCKEEPQPGETIPAYGISIEVEEDEWMQLNPISLRMPQLCAALEYCDIEVDSNFQLLNDASVYEETVAYNDFVANAPRHPHFDIDVNTEGKSENVIQMILRMEQERAQRSAMAIPATTTTSATHPLKNIQPLSPVDKAESDIATSTGTDKIIETPNNRPSTS